MAEFRGVIGWFTDADALPEAVGRAQAAGLRDARAYMPLGDHAVLDRLDPGSSGVRWVSLAGGLTGIATALAMTIWMSLDYPLITGGKPIVSMPPFLIVAFELMVLLGAIATIGGVLWFARLPRLAPSDAYTPAVAVDRFSLFIPCAETSAERTCADRLLREAGAAEVREVRAMGYGPLEPIEETEA